MNNISILFITFYGLIDYVADIINEFESSTERLRTNGINLSTHEFSYLKYQNDDNMTDPQIVKAIIDAINKSSITHLFWFFFPESKNIMNSIKHKCPHIKYIFYNFDDPGSFNVTLVNAAKNIDFFINPNIANEKKYTYIMDKKIYTVSKYVHYDIINLNNDQVKEILNNEECEKVDITILIEDDYHMYDMKEKFTLNQYIGCIKNYCIDNDYTLKLYGDLQLEKIHPGIYEDVVDILFEGLIFRNSKLVIILDVRTGLDKGTNKLILDCVICGAKMLTNSNQVNNRINHYINTSQSKVSSQDNVIRFPDMSLLDKYLKNNAPVEKLEFVQGFAPPTLEEWVFKILNIINYNN